MVTTALLRRKDFAPHSSQLNLVVQEGSDLTKVKATLTGRISTTLQNVQLDLSQFFQRQHRNKKQRNLFKALGDLPHLKFLQFSYAQMERLPVHLLSIALRQSAGGQKVEVLELNHVNLTGNGSDFEEFLAILRRHPSLRAFSFSSSGCSSVSSINAMLEALSETPRLEKLILYSEETRSPWGRLEGRAMDAVCRSSSLKELQHLILYTSSASTVNCFTDEHTIAMARALSNPVNDIANDDNNNAGDQLVDRNNLLAPGGLEEVMITCLPLGRGGVEALCQMLQRNTSLRKLTIVIYEFEETINTHETCNISNLATALQSNSTLESLELHGSAEYGKFIQEAFWELLPNNYSLRHLKLFQDDVLYLRPFIDFYLKLNRAGRGRLLMQDDNITKKDWIDSLTRVRNDISCLFYFLSTNPLLCQND